MWNFLGHSWHLKLSLKSVSLGSFSSNSSSIVSSTLELRSEIRGNSWIQILREISYILWNWGWIERTKCFCQIKILREINSSESETRIIVIFRSSELWIRLIFEHFTWNQFWWNWYVEMTIFDHFRNSELWIWNFD